jgi:WhiB family redox-sensing transcriptional regulator
MRADLKDTTWMARGRCRDVPPEMMFPHDGAGVSLAKRLCTGCPVRARCLEYALACRIDEGVWGGASQRERRRILQQRRRRPAMTSFAEDPAAEQYGR